MQRALFTLAVILSAIVLPAEPQEQPLKASGHYLFAWTGDAEQKGNDFLAIIDAKPASPSYGQLMTTIMTDQRTMRVHHTEYTMPYQRLPNGHVLATFQHPHHGASTEPTGKTGGLVEIDDQGKVVRSAGNADPAFAGTLWTPYGLIVLPEIDRVVSTNSSMQLDDIFAGVTYQVWRLSDLKLLKTAYFDVGENRYAQISPQEPRAGPDGSVLVQTLGCGLERITGVNTDQPRSQLVYTFPGNRCGVPTIAGHYLVQTAAATNGLIVLDITNPAAPVEVSRLKLSDTYRPHWKAWDPKTQRIVVTASVMPGTRWSAFT